MAFGCGAFDNDAHVVSDIFYKVLKDFDYDGMKENDMFRQIDFAVLDHTRDQYNYKEFCRNFSDFYRKEDQDIWVPVTARAGTPAVTGTNL